MMHRITFQEDLEKLHNQLVEMLSLTETAIEKTIRAMEEKDMVLAKEVVDEDDAIDKKERKIEKLCIDILLRQAPMANDMRSITSTFKIITDLERIGDYAEDICSILLEIQDEKYIKPLIDLPKLAHMARAMVNKVITAFMREDIELAKEVCKDDYEVNWLYNKINEELLAIIKNNPAVTEQAIQLMNITKYFEKMADHAVNIGEWVVFNKTGKHKRLPKQ